MANEFDDTTVNAFGGEAGGGMIDIPDVSGVTSKFHATPGNYIGTVTEVNNDPSKKGDPMLCFYFDVDVGKSEPLTLRQYLVQTPGNMFRVAKTIKALGLKQGQTKTSDIVGKQCLVELGDTEYLGEKRSEILLCSPLPAGGSVPDDDIKF